MQIQRLTEPPLFLESSECLGLQVADIIAYGTNMHLKEIPEFDRHWQIIHQKTQKHPP